MKILIDTDVFLDIALDRQPFSAPSAQLLDPIQQGQAEGFVAWHSVSNLYHLCSSEHNDKRVRGFLNTLLSFVKVAPAETADMQRALSLDMKKFEDAMQAAAALACNAKIIATRNIRDYMKSPIRAKRPKEILSDLK